MEWLKQLRELGLHATAFTWDGGKKNHEAMGMVLFSHQNWDDR